MLPKYWNKAYNSNIKKIKIENSVGTLLAHDITEIRPGSFKGTVYNAGHRINENDLCHLKKLGKRHLFVLDLDNDQVHENKAALKLAEVVSWCGINFASQPKEGKIQLCASRHGLFKVNSKTIFDLNMIPEIMCTSIHNNTVVSDNSPLAVIGIMPLFISKSVLNQAIDLIYDNIPFMEVKPFLPLKIGLIITGNEIYDGLVEDGFDVVIRDKLKFYDLDILETIILPDEPDQIVDKIKFFSNKDTNLLIITGGMSIDPDDVTRHAIIKAGADIVHYGAAVSPGGMFQLAYLGDMSIMGIPACALYHKVTILDLILPRLLAGEKPIREDLARLAHGGLCMHCKQCNYPFCPFGKV